jgi:hypothetical protein
MAEKTVQSKICFGIDERTYALIKQFPRSFNLSEQLREAVKTIIHDIEKDGHGKELKKIVQEFKDKEGIEGDFNFGIL